ncbi:MULTISPECIES: hypothetical protein [Streptomyces]|nr:hypothetical protein [Streptomyces canarius]
MSGHPAQLDGVFILQGDRVPERSPAPERWREPWGSGITEVSGM